MELQECFHLCNKEEINRGKFWDNRIGLTKKQGTAYFINYDGTPMHQSHIFLLCH
jgi:hypothetical protein